MISAVNSLVTVTLVPIISPLNLLFFPVNLVLVTCNLSVAHPWVHADQSLSGNKSVFHAISL